MDCSFEPNDIDNEARISYQLGLGIRHKAQTIKLVSLNSLSLKKSRLSLYIKINKNKQQTETNQGKFIT